MSSIAYITDSNLISNHRLNENKRMNFWRLSSNTNFSDFSHGDLVFFLSKDKMMKSQTGEKGIVGFGRLVSIHKGSPLAMWKKFELLNGYNSYEAFKDTLKKNSKDKLLPKVISSFFLENVIFFQTPIYLSEYGVEISRNVESYTYVEDNIAIKILEKAKDNLDMWSASNGNEEKINNEQIGLALSLAYKKAGPIKIEESKIPKVRKLMAKCIEDHPTFRFVKGTITDIYHPYNRFLTIIFYKDKDTDLRTLIGNAILYRKYIATYYPHPLSIVFKTIDNDEHFDEIVN